MAIIEFDDKGHTYLSLNIEPYEFWPYTTIVRDEIVRLPRDRVGDLHNKLIEAFVEHGIKAHVDNKTVFGIKYNYRILYLGFYDFQFSIGDSVHSDGWIKPIRKV